MAEGSTAEDDAPAPTGTAIGRYYVLQTLGQGGMGIVYLAYDPELDRRVALKVVRIRPTSPRQAATFEARLRREAKALASVSHPNVVQVHDVGTHEGRVFIAMELVEGADLLTWRREHASLSWRAVLRVLVDAGRGLAAAHRTGLVHRDFKPANVLVSVTNVAKVADFGLARAATDPTRSEEREDGEAAASPAAAHLAVLTEGGTVLGTPAYMAPEQWRERSVDAKSDQFSYCVALYEAIAGTRPFTASTATEAIAAVERGADEAPLRRAGAPRWLRRAVLRGLRLDPAERHASMDVLVRELEPRRLPGRFALALGVMGVAAALMLAGDDRPDCDARQAAAATWSDARAQAIETAFEATGLDAAPSIWAIARDRLVEHDAAWTETWSEACVATHHRGEASHALLDRRMGCLRRAAAETDALLDVLAAPDPAVVRLAIDAVAALGDPRACLEPDASLPVDDGEAGSVLAAARALERTGHYAQALQEADRARTLAHALERTDLVAEAELIAAFAQHRLGSRAESERLARDAALHAEAAGRDEIKARATIFAIETVGYASARADEGRTLARQALATAHRLGDPPALVGTAHASLGLVETGAGRLDAAVEALELAVAATERAPAIDLVPVLARLGYLEHRRGRYERAHELLHRHLTLAREIYGDEHPKTADAYSLLAANDLSRGRHDDAEAGLASARAIHEAFDASSPTLAQVLMNVASLRSEQRRHAEAIALYERILVITQKVYGSDDPRVAAAYGSMGAALQALSRHDEALAAHRRCLAIFEGLYGTEHPDSAQARHNVATALHASGEHAQALAMLQDVLVVRERLLGPEHDHLAFTLVAIGQAAGALGRHAEAEAALERALALRRKAWGDDSPGLAEAELLLAMSLWRDRSLHDRALALAKSALAHAEHRDGDPDVRDEAKRWLAQHQSP